MLVSLGNRGTWIIFNMGNRQPAQNVENGCTAVKQTVFLGIVPTQPEITVMTEKGLDRSLAHIINAGVERLT